MKKTLALLMILAAGATFFACDKYDDSELKDRVTALEKDVKDLKALADNLQGQITAARAVADAASAGVGNIAKYVTDITKSEAGYLVTFNDKTTLLIDTKITGLLGVSSDNYWTVDGEYLLIDGAKVPVQPLISAVDPAKDKVTFTLSNGETVVIPLVSGFKLIVTSEAQGIDAGASLDINYTINEGTDDTEVNVMPTNGFSAVVKKTDATSGVITVTAPKPYMAGNVLVWADDQKGHTSVKMLSFTENAYVTVSAVTDAPSAAGTYEISVVSNVDVEATSDADWIEYVSTKAGDQTLTFNVKNNPQCLSRKATISFVNKADRTQVISTQVVKQSANTMFTKVWGQGSADEVPWAKHTGLPASLAGNDRNMATDGEFIYIPETKNGSANIHKFKIDGTYLGTLPTNEDMSGDNVSTHPVSWARMIPNSKGDVNGGKPILLVGNLSSGQNIKVYAYLNGVDNAPTTIANFANARRFGDKVTITGSWGDGYIWYRAFETAGMTAYVRLSTTVWNWIEAKGSITTNANNISEHKGYLGWGIITSNTANGGTQITTGTDVTKNYSDISLLYGLQQFEAKGVKYVALTTLRYGTQSPRLQIYKGDITSKDAAIELFDKFDDNLVFEAPLASAYGFTQKGVAGGNTVADCSVAVTDTEVVVVSMAQNTGIAVYKIAL